MGRKVKCVICKAVIQSKHRHDFVSCKCGQIFIDGGDDYTRVGGIKNILKQNDKGEWVAWMEVDDEQSN